MPDTRTVLIVDDAEDVSQLFCDIIRMLDFEPTAVPSGVAALQQLKTNSFDLVILDMRMPDLSGLDTFKAIRQFETNVPVVLTTGFGMDSNVREALSMGALLCIEKPFKVKPMMKTIRDIIEKESPKK